jgi:hypothetical protein
MVWLGLILFIAVAVALLRGGRITNLADIQLRFWWLLPLGFLMQAATVYLPDSDNAHTIGVWLILLSYVPLIVVVIINRTRDGLWLTGFGILMNATVIAINFGMPVMTEAAQIAGGFREDISLVHDYKHVLLDSSTRLAFLADVIPVRLFGLGQVISIGDVLLAVGLGRFLESELRRPIRWFKTTATSASGSALDH